MKIVRMAALPPDPTDQFTNVMGDLWWNNGKVGVNSVVDLGGAGVDYLYFPSQPNPDDFFTIASRIYMFGPTGGGYDVAIAIGGSVSATIDNAVGAVNGDVEAIVNARKGAGSLVLQLTAKLVGAATNFTLTESTAGVRLQIGNATARSNADPREKQIVSVPYQITAQDVITFAAGGQVPIVSYAGPNPPTVGSAAVLSGGGAFKELTNAVSFTVQQFNAENWVIQIADSGAIFVAGDYLLVLGWV